MSVLLVETRSKKLTTQGTGDSHSNRASCEAHIAPSGTRGSYRASYEGETSSPDSEGSYFSYSSPVTRRMTNTVRSSNRGAILAVGEELRQLLHSEQPQIIKDRRYHLRTFEKSFVGHEMVDWLLKKGEVESRREAVAMMQKLLENGVIHHGECMTERKGGREREKEREREVFVSCLCMFVWLGNEKMEMVCFHACEGVCFR